MRPFEGSGEGCADNDLHHDLTQAQFNRFPNYRLGERKALVVLAELNALRWPAEQ